MCGEFKKSRCPLTGKKKCPTPPTCEPLDLQHSSDPEFILASEEVVYNHWDPLHRYVYTTPERCEADYVEWTANIPEITCNCKLKWAELVAANPPDFSSHAAFFKWGVDRHNDVNEHLLKPRITIGEARHLHDYPIWCDVEEDIKPPTSDKLIITIAIGRKFQEILELSRPYLQAYAKKCGADYVELTNPTQGWWGLEKFRVKAFQKYYERIAFLDSDLLVRPNCPNLFDIVEPHRIGMHNDSMYNIAGVSANIIGNQTWLGGGRAALLNSQGVYLKSYIEPVCQNSGVVVFSKHHDIWNGMTKPFPRSHCDEQFWVERQAQKYSIQQLTYHFNTQYWFGHGQFQKLKPSAYIIHFSGVPGNKLKLMKDELSTWKE
jgi:hypothetical protein